MDGNVLNKCAGVQLNGCPLLPKSVALIACDLHVVAYPYRICQKYCRKDQANGQRSDKCIFCGLAIVQNTFDALLDADFPKGQRAGRDEAPRHRAGQKGSGIGLLLCGSHCRNDCFVTGKLHIPAEEQIANPNHGIEPVDAQQQKAQALPPVIPTPNMGALVGDDAIDLLLGNIRWKVDFWLHKSQNEGGGDMVTEVYIAPVQDTFPRPSLDMQEAHCGIEEHKGRTDGPEGHDRGQIELRCGEGHSGAVSRALEQGCWNFQNGFLCFLVIAHIFKLPVVIGSNVVENGETAGKHKGAAQPQGDK